jgi:hypothetical protein
LFAVSLLGPVPGKGEESSASCLVIAGLSSGQCPQLCPLPMGESWDDAALSASSGLQLAPGLSRVPVFTPHECRRTRGMQTGPDDA